MLMYVLTFSFAPITLATTDPMHDNKPPLPQAASEALINSISAFSHFTKEEVKASTPGTNEAWRNYVHARNSEQKKKIKKMKKALNVDIELDSYQGDNITLELVDLNGRVAKQQKITLERGFNSLNVNIDELPKGVYLLKFLGSKNHIKETRIIKQ